jgi:hypothetical protein
MHPLKCLERPKGAGERTNHTVLHNKLCITAHTTVQHEPITHFVGSPSSPRALKNKALAASTVIGTYSVSPQFHTLFFHRDTVLSQKK